MARKDAEPKHEESLPEPQAQDTMGEVMLSHPAPPPSETERDQYLLDLADEALGNKRNKKREAA